MLYSSIQVVFLVDTSIGNDQNKNEIEQYASKLILCMLRIMTEFGANTDKAIENVRWSYKFYDSSRYKPDTSKKSLYDFNKSELEKSYKEIQNKLLHPNSSTSLRTRYARSVLSPYKRMDETKSHSGSFILNKALQEVLLDYDWERLDMSSPVKQKLKMPNSLSGKRHVRNQSDCDELNFVILLSNFPNNFSELCEFCHISLGSSTSTTAAQAFKMIFDPATLEGFQKEKKLRFHIINMKEPHVNCSVKASLQKELNKVEGGIHEIKDLVFSYNFPLVPFEQPAGESLDFPLLHPKTFFSKEFKGLHFNLNKKLLSARRKPLKGRSLQLGPAFVWEDVDGISYLKLQLKVLSLQGSSVRSWDQVSVCGVAKSSSTSFLGLAHEKSHCFVCHSADPTFEEIMNLLQEQNLILIVKLSCDGLGVLSPWIQSLGLIVVFSTSCLASPPISMESMENQYFGSFNFAEFFSTIIKKVLLKLPPVKPLKSNFTQRFCPQHLKPWFVASTFNAESFPSIKPKAKSQKHLMFEKLQKKYRPSLPLSDTSSAPPLIDVSQIGESAAGAPLPECSTACLPPALPNPNATRAQQMVKKSKIVSAHLKVKEQKEEEKEQLAVNEKKKVEAQNRSEKYRALAYKALLDTNPQDKQEVVAMLMKLRDEIQHEETSSEDIYTTAQTIINLALMHFKSMSLPFSLETNFQELMSEVLLTAQAATCTYKDSNLLRQLRLQTFLHLELVWLLGYSNASIEEDIQNPPREELRAKYVEEILKHLRCISLHFEPRVMGDFLQQEILHNCQDTLGETLVEIYEELNQPLPEPLRAFVSGDEESPEKHHFLDDSTPIKEPKSDPIVGAPVSKDPGRSGRLLLKRESSNRQIVVPQIKRNIPLRRVRTQRDNQPSEKKEEEETKRVCRNLFVQDKPKKSTKFRRHKTIGCFSTASPAKNENKRNCQKRTRDDLRLDDCNEELSHAQKENNMTPNAKKVRVLAPETPANRSAATIFMQQRLCKSTGVTIIQESPDKAPAPISMKGVALTRRRSFYSGACSRNCEKGQESLLASHIKGVAEKSEVPSSCNVLQKSNSLFSNFIQDKPS